MAEGLKTIIYPVSDLATAKGLFGRLFGVEPYMDEPYYVAFDAGGQDVGLDPNGHQQGMTAPLPYWHVDDLESAIVELVAAGATAHQAPRDVGGGNRTASVKDPDGNVVGLFQAA